MPELPEVETIRLGLEKYLVGHRILDVEIKVPKLFEGNPKDIAGGKVQKVRRFGKGLVIDLDNDYSLAIHIKLTGQLIYRGPKVSQSKAGPPLAEKVSDKVGSVPSKFTHVIFKLDQNSFLYYNDVRRFGWIKVVETSKVHDLPFFKNMGPEPFKDLTLDYFKKVIMNSNLAVKPLIMDQKRIGGVGNIYANDALFDAKIDPRRPAKSLSSSEVKNLYDSILKVLKLGLKYQGATEVNFVNVKGEEGGYQEHFLAYGREGEKCGRCGSIIKKMRLGGRGTYFCEKCQK